MWLSKQVCNVSYQRIGGEGDIAMYLHVLYELARQSPPFTATHAPDIVDANLDGLCVIYLDAMIEKYSLQRRHVRLAAPAPHIVAV